MPELTWTHLEILTFVVRMTMISFLFYLIVVGIPEVVRKIWRGK